MTDHDVKEIIKIVNNIIAKGEIHPHREDKYEALCWEKVAEERHADRMRHDPDYADYWGHGE